MLKISSSICLTFRRAGVGILDSGPPAPGQEKCKDRSTAGGSLAKPPLLRKDVTQGLPRQSGLARSMHHDTDARTARSLRWRMPPLPASGGLARPEIERT